MIIKKKNMKPLVQIRFLKYQIVIFFLSVDYSWENKNKEKTIDLFPRRESNPGRGGESAES